jgi:hypothetical protein
MPVKMREVFFSHQMSGVFPGSSGSMDLMLAHEKGADMPVCSDCFLYRQTNASQGECKVNGPVPADRDAERCPSRTFRPKG